MSESSQWIAGWLASEQTSEDVIAVKRAYIDINDANLHDGIIFSQIMYWHGRNKETGKPRLTVMHEGELWLAKSYDDWFDECRIIPSTARKCLDRIEERGLIIKKLFKFDGAPVVHIRVNWEELERRIKSICYPVSNPNDTTGQNHSIPHSKSLTENTSETTTDKPDTRKRDSVSNPSKWNDSQLEEYYGEHSILIDGLLLLTGIDVAFVHWGEMTLAQRREYIRVTEHFMIKGIVYDDYVEWLKAELVWRRPFRVTLKDFTDNIARYRTMQNTKEVSPAQPELQADEFYYGIDMTWDGGETIHDYRTIGKDS